MGYRLAKHQFAATIGDRTVVLDLVADRYRLLGSRATEALGALGEDVSRTPGLEALLRAGIVEPGSARAQVPILPRPQTSAAEIASHGKGKLSFGVSAFTLLSEMAAVRCRGLIGEIDSATERAVSAPVCIDRLAPLARAYVQHRSMLPFRHICLPDSLALHRILAARGLASSLVIGVRLDPFGAHCWVQADTVVLNDSYDGVSGFTPILTV
jgi:hypothetical protein